MDGTATQILLPGTGATWESTLRSVHASLGDDVQWNAWMAFPDCKEFPDLKTSAMTVRVLMSTLASKLVDAANPLENISRGMQASRQGELQEVGGRTASQVHVM